MEYVESRRFFSASIFKQRSVMFSLVLLALFAQLGRAADALRFTKNYFVTGDVVTAGVGGFYGTGVNGFATGTITMSGASGVPCTGGSPAALETCSTPGAVPATIVAAFLYWSTVETTSTPSGANAFFDGNGIVGTVRGNPNNPGCFSSGGTSSGFGRVYGADVRRFLPPDATDSVRTANGPHVVKLPDSGGGGNGNVKHALGASLVVVYKFVVPGQPLFAPLRSVVIYDGSSTMDKFTGSTNQHVGGFYDALGGLAKITQIVANGQSFNTETLTINNAPPLSGPSTPFTGAAGSRWDNPTFSFNLAPHANSVDATLTTSDHQICITSVATVISAVVTDTDHDGLLDAWETSGLHLNPGDSTHPATFGGCADYNEPCVNLHAMGADPLKQDIFVEIDWLHGTSGGDHTHIPKLAALNAIGGTFSLHGINLHFDVGNNYPAPGSPYIVPAAYAQGGEVIEESSLACPNAVVTKASLCAYTEPYSVLSWKLGYQDVRNGNSALGIPAHFAYNRKDAFHYALFGHALGGPFDPTTGKPKSTDPNSVSGIADQPGGDFMVTLGLWPADDPVPCDPQLTCVNQTGSVNVQAGTIMHELGHNLGLGHAGAYRTPNCMPNYPSVMNYLHQVHLLTGTGDGKSYLDYSAGQRAQLNETSLNESAPLGGPPYRVRFYAPANGVGTPALTHCDGTPTGGALMVRIESAGLATPDWNNNGIVDVGTYLQDINFDGSIGAGVAGGPNFVDSNDWLSLNLQQISARPNGGLSSGVGILEDPSGGILEDPSGGVLEDPSGGVLEDPSGGVLEDPSGGVLEDPSGGILSDVNHNTTASQPEPGGALAATSSLTAITLNWGAPDPSLAQIDHFNVYRTADPSVRPTTPIASTPNGTTTTFTDTVGGPYNTSYNQTYTYFVTSVVKITGAESVFSNSAHGIVKHLFVTALNPTKVYGDPLPTLFTATGLDLPFPAATCTTTATQTSPVGAYPITCGPTPVTEDGPNGINGITYTNGTLTITGRPITVTAASSSKTYDATTASTSIPTITSGTLAPGDTGSFTETYDTKNVGINKTMIPAGSVTNGASYSITFVNSTNGIIKQAPLTITAATNTKTYDSTTSALAVPTVAGLQGNTDTVTGLAETYDNKNAGSGKTLTVSAYTINDNNSGGNYIVTTATNTTGVINKAPLTITAATNTKTYDSTTSALAVPTVAGLQGNTDTVTGLAETYDNKNAGTAKTLTVSAGYTVSDGNGGGNYIVTTATNTTGVVNKAPLTITALTNTKTYDGTTSAAATPTVSGLKGTDTVTGLAETYDTKNAGTGKTLSPSAYTINDGNSGGNYAVSTVTNTTGVINKAPLTVKADNKTRPEFTANPPLTASYSGFKNGETLGTSGITGSPALTTTATFNSDEGNYPISITNGTLASGNYAFTFVNGIFTVTP